MSTVHVLSRFRPEKEFFVGIDSDGCVFDSMELKHRKCFAPAFIETYELQEIAETAEAVWDFVNLYSRSRGCNRFIALDSACRYLSDLNPDNSELKARLDLPDLRSWLAREQKLGNPALLEEVSRTGSRELERVRSWSLLVNEFVEKTVTDVPPFSGVPESLAKLSARADIMVVSQTPYEAIAREWKQHGIDSYIREIAGQELGTKQVHLEEAAAGKYAADKILMIGDAPGDHESARRNGMLFFPIIPGEEEQSWQRMQEEAADRFFSGTYAGSYEEMLVERFYEKLPVTPPWQKRRAQQRS
jgi:phosphoglycolate phosphatase-like HAD superfamily hydrolase